MSSVYTITKIAHKTWRISEAGKMNCYLLEGDTSALLIDSCWGVGDLYGIVKSITSKPLAIVATHLHPDHVGGTKQFGKYYVHEADLNFINIRSHTHGGQMIPIVQLLRWFRIGTDCVYGMERRGDTEFVVSSGISDWALRFKTGCRSEYVIIDVAGR